MNIISGAGYRTYARYALDHRGFIENPAGKADVYFCKTDCLEIFADIVLPDIATPFVLMSGDSDQPIVPNRRGVKAILACDRLVRWLSLNVALIHPKLFSIPIGVAYSYQRPHVPAQILEIAAQPPAKTRAVYASYKVENSGCRRKCLAETGGLLFPYVRKGETDHREYLTEVATSYFNISPNGNGWDCFRHWESLYLRTVPIVTDDNINIRFHRDMPFLMLKDWSDYRTLNLDRDLYARLWGEFDPGRLDFERVMDHALTRPHPLV